MTKMDEVNVGKVKINGKVHPAIFGKKEGKEYIFIKSGKKRHWFSWLPNLLGKDTEQYDKQSRNFM